MTKWLFIATLCAASLVAAQIVSLPYDVSVEPVQHYVMASGNELAKPLLAYFGIPYAEPPLGDLRFQHPTKPKRGNGKVLRNRDFGKVCLQAGPHDNQSEDCLTLSVFMKQRDTNIKKLPVLIWTHGGAFNSGSGGENGILPDMVGNARQDFIGVSFNYRLGALGFLPSNLTQKAGLLNLGLEDQRMAYDWVQSHIELFGGDPDRVTIWGESAGAHSCGAHLQHIKNGNQGKPPFSQMIMNSGGPTAAVKTDWTYSLHNEQMAEFLDRTNCAGDDPDDVFECLREADAEAIREASSSIFTEYSSPPRWPFQPVVDGKYIQQSPMTSWNDGVYNKEVSVITGFNTDEGAMFVPRDQRTNDAFRAFWQTLFPRANSTLLDTIERLYPNPVSGKAPAIRTGSEGGEQFQRLSAAFGDYIYVSTVRKTAESMSQGGSRVWKYHFDFAPQLNGEVPMVEHASELAYFTKHREEPIAQVMNDYYASFIVYGDPNADVPSEYPEWPQYEMTKPKQMTFGTRPEIRPDTVRESEVEFWMNIAEDTLL